MPILFLIVFVDLVGFGLIIPLLPFYAERFGASPQVVTILLAIFSLMSMISAPLWGRISDRIGRRPVLMASAMKKAIEAGREAFLAGRMPRKSYAASPSSPTVGEPSPR